MRAAMSVFGTIRTSGLRPDDRTYNTLMQGWIESKDMDRAMDLFKQMKRNRQVRPDIVTYNLLINGWSRSMRRMDMVEKVMQELMNDPCVSPNNRTFCAIFRGYSCLFHENRNWRAERMYYWLCKMRDMKIKPNQHTMKPFSKMNLYFPSYDEPFWKNYGVPYDPRRDCSPRRRDRRHR
jgi:pentatricopeptide repeat protein